MLTEKPNPTTAILIVLIVHVKFICYPGSYYSHTCSMLLVLAKEGNTLYMTSYMTLSLITRSLRSSMYFRLKGDTVVQNVKHVAIAGVLCRWPLEC